MIIGLFTGLVMVVKCFYELDLHCNQIISSVPCLSDCEWYGRIIPSNSEHSLKIMSCNYSEIIAQVDFKRNTYSSRMERHHIQGKEILSISRTCFRVYLSPKSRSIIR